MLILKRKGYLRGAAPRTDRRAQFQILQFPKPSSQIQTKEAGPQLGLKADLARLDFTRSLSVHSLTERREGPQPDKPNGECSFLSALVYRRHRKRQQGLTFLRGMCPICVL